MSQNAQPPAFTVIDLAGYPRRRAYEYFKAFDVPVTSTTMQLDIGAFRDFTRRRELRFFATLSFLITETANRIPEFRHRIRDDVLVAFARVAPSFTVLSPEKTLNFAKGVYTGDFATDYGANLERLARAARGLDQVAGPEDQGQIFITNLPWFSFTAIGHPYARGNASIPIFSLGKAWRDGDRTRLPFAMQTNHALVDGYHMGCFVEQLTAFLDRPAQLLGDMPLTTND